MKKAAKKLNRSKRPAPKSTKKSMSKAMAAKPAKKAQTKKPAPAPKAAKVAAAKAPAKVSKKEVLKTAPVAAPTPVAKGKAGKGVKETVVAVLPAAKLTKGAKGAKDGKIKPITTAKSAQAIRAAEAAGEKLCREAGCENYATTKGYCRLDYLKNWKKIKRKEMILKEGKLNNYIEELVSKYPDKYIDVIRQDLSTEVNFNKVIHDLELDESIDDLDYDGDSIDSLIGSIKKEADEVDDGDF